MEQINFKELGKGLFIIILYLVIVPTIVQLLSYPFLKNMQGNNLFLTIINLLVYIIDIIIVFIIYRKSIFKEAKDYKKNFRKYSKVAITYWAKGFVLMLITNFILTTIIGELALNETSNRELLNELPIFSTIAMVFLGPIMEEIAFRKGFVKAFKNENWYLYFTAILFGGMHIFGSLDYSSISSLLNSWQQFLYIIPYSILGYYFAKAYRETNCIFTSITSHMLHNGLSVFLIFLAGLLG